MEHGIAPKVYASAKSAHLKFCQRLNLSPLPATLILFVAELHQTKAISTIHTYLAGVRHLHIRADYPSPLINTLKLQLVLRGCKQLKPPKTSTRLPITPGILLRVKSSLVFDYKGTMLWTAMCLAFFGFYMRESLQLLLNLIQT